MVIARIAVFLVSLDPAQGAETAKPRPCVVASPDDMNDALATVIIAALTTVRRHWPTRPARSHSISFGQWTKPGW